MKKPLLYSLTFLLLIGLSSCEDNFEDTIPASFFNIQLNPDVIYIYNTNNPDGVRLDPMVNDSIKVDVTITFGTPAKGTIKFIVNEGWFYKPQSDYVGTDNFSYTVCHQGKCSSADITMHVEAPLDLNNCTSQITGEAVETQRDQPIAIRIFENDMVCPYQGSSIFAPEKGRFNTYSYSGTFKNIVYVYYPPKGFVGIDKFKYKLFTANGDLEATCTITVKP